MSRDVGASLTGATEHDLAGDFCPELGRGAYGGLGSPRRLALDPDSPQSEQFDLADEVAAGIDFVHRAWVRQRVWRIVLIRNCGRFKARD